MGDCMSAAQTKQNTVTPVRQKRANVTNPDLIREKGRRKGKKKNINISTRSPARKKKKHQPEKSPTTKKKHPGKKTTIHTEIRPPLDYVNPNKLICLLRGLPPPSSPSL